MLLRCWSKLQHHFHGCDATNRGSKVTLASWVSYHFPDDDQFFTMEWVKLILNCIFFGLQHLSSPRNIN
uniref:Uncharacterized protein n=1 Tax=Triticum urartu TaxID=4572 RepID=A0A8R7QXB4_TRIUA